MNFAWATVALLLFLLPGALFFVGIYIPEQFTRETAQRSALGQLAGTVLVSLVVQSFAFLVLQLSWWPDGLPSPNLEYVFAALQLAGSTVTPKELASNIERNAFWIATYLLGTAAGGVAIGWGVGELITRGRLSFLTQHRWVYELRLDQPGGARTSVTFAYVVTNIRRESDDGGAHLLYRGILKQFHLMADGRFSYLVLKQAEHCYLRLGEDRARISEKVHVIGSSSRPAPHLDPEETPAETWVGRRWQNIKAWFAPDMPLRSPIFVVEGEDIANVYFERRPYTQADAAVAAEAVVLVEQAKAMERGIKAAAEDVMDAYVDRVSRTMRAPHGERPTDSERADWLQRVISGQPRQQSEATQRLHERLREIQRLKEADLERVKESRRKREAGGESSGDADD